MPPALSLAVVGADYPNKGKGPPRRFELAMCKPGEPIELIPEPKNPKDEHAIAVFSARGVQIGYLTAERAPWIGGMMSRGVEVQAIFQRLSPWGCWIRAAFDGEVPSVAALPTEPQTRQPIDPEPDWYPDEEWPDE